MDLPGPRHGGPAVAPGGTLTADAELVARMAAGDEAALAAAYDHHADAVYTSVMDLLGDREAAEAIVQDVYLAAWRQAGQYTPGAGSLRAWLLGFAHSLATGSVLATERRPRLMVVGGREDQRDAQVRGTLPAAQRAGDAGEAGAGANDRAARPWELALARTALAAMAAPERQVLRLAYEAGLTQAEIAAHLGLPIGEVNTRTRRALANLGSALDGVTDLADDAAGRAMDVPAVTDAPWRSTGGRDAAR